MSSSNTLLDTIATNQANKEVVANALFDAASPSMLWGRHASACNGLTWGYYGGYYGSNAVANSTLALTASTTNYVYADNVTGAVSVNVTGVPAGKIPLYSIVTGATTVTSYNDMRSYAPQSQTGVSFGNQTANVVFAGPSSGAAAAPTFRTLVGADVPVFGASGANHAPGAVPDPGATAGNTRFLREDGTFQVPAGAGGASTLSGLTDVNVSEGPAIDGFSLVWNNATSRWIAKSVTTGGGAGSSPTFVEQTANYLANAGDAIAANTSAGPFTIQLPASPAAGASVEIADELQTFDLNPLTINPNGSKIGGLGQNMMLTLAGQYASLVYMNATVGWLVTGGVAPYNGVQFNLADDYPAVFLLASNGRQIQSLQNSAAGGWRSIRATPNSARAAGKLYFEFRVERQDNYNPMIGVGSSTATLAGFVGTDANGWGMTLGTSAAMYHSGSNSAQNTYAVGDICGVAVDFTAGTGSIQFLKNNVANGSFTGLTLGTLYPIASADAGYGSSAGTIRTRAAQCIYAPPNGFSYWDS